MELSRVFSKEFLYWRWFLLRLSIENRRHRRFDKQFGTDTAAELPLAAAGISEADASRGNGIYRAIWEGAFFKVMRRLRIDHSQYTFIDFGSGKGKVLLLASRFPFHQVIGVEYAPALHEAARNNCALYKDARQRCTDIVPILSDALAYPIPEGPLVCFFFNPFESAILKKVIGNVEQALQKSERPIYLVYLNQRTVSEAGSAFDDINKLHLLRRSRWFVVYSNAT